MGKEMKRTEDALRKIRVDFPTALQSTYQPGPVIQEILSSERKEDEFFNSLEMLSRGMHPLIDENSEALKESALKYHEVHKRIRASYNHLAEAESKVTHLLSSLSSQRVPKHLQALKQEVEQVKKEEKERRVKEALAVDTLSIKEIHAGRLEVIRDNLKRVSSSFARSEIKKKTEAEAWKIMKEIEKKIERALRKEETLSPVKLEAYRAIGGSFINTLHKSVKSSIIERINKTSESIRESLYEQNKLEARREKEVLSSCLSEFLEFHSLLLKRTFSLLQSSREKPKRIEMNGFSHNSVLYREIELGEAHSSHSSLSFPVSADRHTEEEILSLFIEWPKRFLSDLRGSAKKEEKEYDISSMTRTPESTRMYSDMFIGKYGGDTHSASEEAFSSSAYTKHTHKITGEESHLVIHGISLILAEETRKILSETLPEKAARADELKDEEISVYFTKKRESLTEEIQKATRKTQSEHKNSFLEKYVERIKKILKEIEEFTEMSAEGLISHFYSVTENSFSEIFRSIDQVTSSLLGVAEPTIKEIKYSEDLNDESIIKEIIKWNHPLEADVLGASLFLKSSDVFYASLSSFLLLRRDAEQLLRKTKENLSDQHSVTLPEPEHVLTYRYPNPQVEGYFISHFLSLSRVVLDQLTGNGEITETRLFHFLESSSYFTKISAAPLLIYSSIHLFLNIKKCSLLVKNPSFKRNLSLLQTRLDALLPDISDTYTYAPEYIFYAIEAITSGDAIYLRALQRIFSCSAVERALNDYHNHCASHNPLP